MRRLGAVLTAVEAQKKQTIELATGDQVLAAKGDWLIYQGDTLLDVSTTRDLLTRYDVLQDRRLVLDQESCESLERTTGIGSTRNTEELIKSVERLASIHIGDVRIAFTPGQLEELTHRAHKRGFMIGQEIERIVDRIRDELFFRS